MQDSARPKFPPERDTFAEAAAEATKCFTCGADMALATGIGWYCPNRRGFDIDNLHPEFEEEVGEASHWAKVSPGPVEKERENLVRAITHNHVDVADWKAYDAAVLAEKVETVEEAPCSIISFGFANGEPEADHVIDCRVLHDPHDDLDLKALRGTDAIVQERLRLAPEFPRVLLEGVEFAIMNPGLTLAFGCSAGHHRSVAMAELTAEWLLRSGRAVIVEHRDIAVERSRG